MIKPTDAAVERFVRAICKEQGIDPDKLDSASLDYAYWEMHARVWLACFLEQRDHPLSMITEVECDGHLEEALT